MYDSRAHAYYLISLHSFVLNAQTTSATVPTNSPTTAPPTASPTPFNCANIDNKASCNNDLRCTWSGNPNSGSCGSSGGGGDPPSLELHQRMVLAFFVIQRDPRAETAVTVVLEGKKNHVFAFSSLLASGLAVIALTYSV